MIQIKKIFLFFITILVLLVTIGVNITEHSCSSCGVHEKNVAFVSTHEHNDVEVIETDCSSHNSCCQSKDILKSYIERNESHSDNCCDFDNKYFKLINLFSPENIMEVVDASVLTISSQFTDILLNIITFKFDRKIFLPIKIPNSIPILSKISQLIL